MARTKNPLVLLIILYLNKVRAVPVFCITNLNCKINSHFNFKSLQD